jgi:hypothetical protein
LNGKNSDQVSLNGYQAIRFRRENEGALRNSKIWRSTTGNHEERRRERFPDIGERESIIRRTKGYFWNYKNTSKKYSDVLPNLIGSL